MPQSYTSPPSESCELSLWAFTLTFSFVVLFPLLFFHLYKAIKHELQTALVASDVFFSQPGFTSTQNECWYYLMGTHSPVPFLHPINQGQAWVLGYLSVHLDLEKYQNVRNKCLTSSSLPGFAIPQASLSPVFSAAISIAHSFPLQSHQHLPQGSPSFVAPNSRNDTGPGKRGKLVVG